MTNALRQDAIVQIRFCRRNTRRWLRLQVAGCKHSLASLAGSNATARPPLHLHITHAGFGQVPMSAVARRRTVHTTQP